MSGERTGGPGAELHPVSPGQRALWLLHRRDPKGAGAAYTIAAAGRVQGAFDPDACRAAFEALVRRHPALRTVFPERSGERGAEPAQRILPAGEIDFFERIDASSWDDDEVPMRLADLAYRPFDLERGPLFRVILAERDRGSGAPEWSLALALHHVVGDLWSLAVVVRELGRAYGARVEGRDPEADLPPLAATHTDWVRRREELRGTEEEERLWGFWREYLDRAPPLDLPTDRPRPPVQSFAGGLVARSLEPDERPRLRRALGRLARRCGTNRFTALMAAYQVVLARWSGQDDFLIGSPTAGRGSARSELGGVVGYFVNPVVVRSGLRHGPARPTFAELLTRLGEESAAALAHQELPFPWIARELGDRDPSRAPLFQTMMVLQKSPLPGTRGLGAFALGREGAPLRLRGLELESIPLPQRGAQFDLSLFVTDEEGSLVGSLEYCSDLFDRATAERLLGHLATLLEAAVAEPDRPVADLPMLRPDERRQILGSWAVGGRGDARAAPPPGRGLLERFAARAAEAPEAEALLCGDERLSYGDLERRSARLARGLRAVGVGPEVPVGVFLERTSDLAVALLGVLRAGGAYVPMDPAYPEERLELMVHDSGMRVAVAGEELAERLPQRVRAMTPAALDGASPADDAPLPADDPDRLSHVIYTSGSTGRPKGVGITRRSVGALIDWAERTFDAEELSGVLAATSVCFDLSVFELLVPLALGGRVILAPDALALPSLAAAGEVSLVNTVPSAMEGLCREDIGLPEGVRTVCLAGEPLRRRLVDAVYRAGAVDRVLNLYGPSEDTTYSTEASCPAEDPAEPTIGRVLPGGRAHVVDRHLWPVPQGIPGELLLGGVGLARGYLGRPALTAERFVPDPFGDEAGPAVREPGGRLYRTGDLVRWLPGGELQFLGRLDHQVKLRGFRIELGEVENTLEGHPEVREVAAAVRGEGAERRLVAYWCPERSGEQETPGVAGLRAFLGRRTPAYTVPDVFVELEALPRTPNGKVDRAALPEPPGGRQGVAGEYVAPETEVEKMLAAMWCEALDVERLGIHDSFFELGGHSLAAHQILVRVRETFGVDVPVPRLFEDPTIAGLSVAIAEALVERADEKTVTELIGSIE